jgi:hypothetical protein
VGGRGREGGVLFHRTKDARPIVVPGSGMQVRMLTGYIVACMQEMCTFLCVVVCVAVEL